MSKKYLVNTFYVNIETNEKVVPTFFGLGASKTVTECTPAQPDISSLRANLEKCLNDYDESGYDIHSILPLAVGSTDEYRNNKGDIVFTASYSTTRGVIVVAKKRD